MWELDYEENWALKYWCFWTVLLEKTLDSPLESKEIQSVHPKGKQFWMFLGRTDAEAETPILWLPDEKSWLIWRDPSCLESLKAGGEKDDRGWDGWMASLIQWTWVWASSGSWWWIGWPGVLQSRGLQKVRHHLVIEQQQWGNRGQESQGIFPGNISDLTVSCVRKTWSQVVWACVLCHCSSYAKTFSCTSKSYVSTIILTPLLRCWEFKVSWT